MPRKRTVLTKTELVDRIHKDLADCPENDGRPVKKSVIRAVVNAALANARAAVAEGDDIIIVGYLSSDVRHTAARGVCNPRTGERMTIPAHDTLHLRPGKELVDAMREAGAR